jgi:hypothetical protein
MNILKTLKYMRLRLDKTIELLEAEPTLDEISELLEWVGAIDRYYQQEYCDENDEAYGLKPGTSYEQGINSEFYIESDDWHQISLAYRNIMNRNKKEVDTTDKIV